MMKRIPTLFLFVSLFNGSMLYAQDFLTNVPDRKQTSLNGKWQAIIDPYDVGIKTWKALYLDKKPVEKTEFYEYSFDGGPTLNVPGEFNTQYPELKNYESTVWYKKTFEVKKQVGKRLFLYFDAVNYQTDVYLNSVRLGSHEGGFTPFQFEITEKIKEGTNAIIVRVNNERQKNGVPATGYDWLNYGGITRDVRLVETPTVYIDDYFIQLAKNSKKEIEGYVKLAGVTAAQQVLVQIPEANIRLRLKTNADGYAEVKIPAKLKLWSPSNPKLYKVMISCLTDTVSEEIGFRSIQTKGTEILLNGESVFLKGINIHEEIPQRKGRAYSESDALMLLLWAKELGCNFIRTAHYPHNENMVRMAERMGFMIWEEVPVFQGLSFENAQTRALMDKQLKEIVRRDKNRCSIITWSVANETPASSVRTKVLTNLATLCRSLDSTRLISAAFNNLKYKGNKVIMEDSLIHALDVIGVNEYIGWYKPWTAAPSQIEWVSNYNKPMIMSEFGCEALFGNHGPSDVASSWSEEYMEQFFKDQVTMLKRIPFLRGTCPWILADFQSPLRLHPTYQQGWNRKGLLSDKGEKKKAWHVIRDFYSGKDSMVADSKPTAKPKFEGYLWAYFEGSGTETLQEQIRFAVSSDGTSWSALNNNEPILASDRISKTGGVRDPHILRGEDGKSFYMVATDMNSIQNGWTTNPGMVLMKSNDLVHWTHTYLDFPAVYPKSFAKVQYVWAPQTIYDPIAKKYVVYFTIKFKGAENLVFYSAYANAAFTGFESEPKILFSPKFGAIDADIILKDGLYHLFMKGNVKDESGKELKSGIQQATSKSLQGPWVEDFKFLDAYSATDRKTNVEGSGIFKLNNADIYVMMYDLYGRKKYEFVRSSDLFHFTTWSESFVKNFVPRHGTVMGITKKEAETLNAKWGGVPYELLEKQ